MTYSVRFTDTAEKQLKKLEKKTQGRILAVLERIRIRPYSFVEKLTGYPFYRMKAGDYRIIMDIRNDELLILVVEVGHRRNIYK